MTDKSGAIIGGTNCLLIIVLLNVASWLLFLNHYYTETLLPLYLISRLNGITLKSFNLGGLIRHGPSAQRLELINCLGSIQCII